MEVQPVVHCAGKVSRLHNKQRHLQQQQQAAGGMTGVRLNDGGKNKVPNLNLKFHNYVTLYHKTRHKSHWVINQYRLIIIMTVFLVDLEIPSAVGRKTSIFSYSVVILFRPNVMETNGYNLGFIPRRETIFTSLERSESLLSDVLNN